MQKITVNESKIKKIVAESLKKMLCEGPGAGYELTFKGLKLDPDSVELTGTEKMNGYDTFTFKAKIQSCDIDEWSAYGYYYGINSEEDYCDKHVNGGFVEGYVYVDDLDEDNQTPEYAKDLISYDIKCTKTFDVEKYMYGGGYIHSFIGEGPLDMVSTEGEITTIFDEIFIDRVVLDATEIFQDIDEFFKNPYGEDDDETEELNEISKSTQRMARQKMKDFGQNKRAENLFRTSQKNLYYNNKAEYISTNMDELIVNIPTEGKNELYVYFFDRDQWWSNKLPKFEDKRAARIIEDEIKKENPESKWGNKNYYIK